MTTTTRIALTLSAALLSLATTADLIAADKAPTYAVQKTIPIGGEGRWDYASVDPAAGRLYVTRTTHTEVIDLKTDQVVLDIPGQKRSHGAVAIPSINRGFITDGGAGAILVFDLKTGAVLGNIPAAPDADGEVYDPSTNRLLVSCGDAGKLLLLDPSADPKTTKPDAIDLEGKPEFLAADGKGVAYVNLTDKNQVVVVDLKTQKVTARYPTGDGAKPTGMAIDPEHGRLYVGCRNQKLIVMNLPDGHILADLPIGPGNDACGFDPATATAFASQSDGTLAVIHETAPGSFAITQTVQTLPMAKTLAIDPTTHNLYLPTADLEPTKPGQRPTPKPDSFKIVVVVPTVAK